MLNFLDANVWLALLWSRHVHSEAARAWFEQAEEQQFFFCRFTQLTVLRLLTAEQIMGSDTKTMVEAWGLWGRIWADTRIEFLPEPEGLSENFVRAPDSPADHLRSVRTLIFLPLLWWPV